MQSSVKVIFLNLILASGSFASLMLADLALPRVFTPTSCAVLPPDVVDRRIAVNGSVMFLATDDCMVAAPARHQRAA